MTSKQKTKGTRFESWLANQLSDNGIPSVRVPLSGSIPSLKGDVLIGTLSNPTAQIECKHRQDISARLWDWLSGNDYLCVKRNHKKPLVVMDIDTFIRLYKEHKI